MVLIDKGILFWTLLNFGDWDLYVAATEKGLAFVGSNQQSIEELENWKKKYFPNSQLVEENEMLKPYISELIEYLQGNRKSFSIPFDIKGTSFQLNVWNALKEIPYSQTRTYSDIANYINKPKAVRAVGTAIGANPLLISIPCHRVIGKDGSLTGYRGGLEMKKHLLRIEQDNIPQS